MTAKEYVRELNDLVYKLQENHLNDLLNKLIIRPRKRQTSYDDELSSLINNYKMEEVEVGQISFFDEYEVTNKYFLFGKVEMDFLAIERSTREIVLLDHDLKENILLKCTKNSSAFLSFLLIYSKFTAFQIVGKPFEIPQIEEIYLICGGLKYKNFVDWSFNSN